LSHFSNKIQSMQPRDINTEGESLLHQGTSGPNSSHNIPQKRIKYEVSHSLWTTKNHMKKREISKKCRVQGQYLNKRQVKKVFFKLEIREMDQKG